MEAENIAQVETEVKGHVSRGFTSFLSLQHGPPHIDKQKIIFNFYWGPSIGND